ncbi:MAG: type II toxin-antitoxin system Phd/YefM family antitoxin [Candidatus Sumerlaeia bacterium]|nr:type II toxin-antitoxin system Phd/YefM family antitoxin [Candidatus Sumerlaeia bacterium]
MVTIQDSEANSHFAELLDRVERGERVAVLRGDRHVATIVPAACDATKAHAAMDRNRVRREKIRLEGRGLSLSEVIASRDSGRR